MYLIIDLEATCWDTKDHDDNEIIEIGAVMVSDDYRVVSEFQTFVKPVRNPILSDFCKGLTSITQEQVDSGADFMGAMWSLVVWAEIVMQENGLEPKFNDLVFCSWGMYDQNQFRKDCQFHKVHYRFGIHRSIKHEFMLDKHLQGCGMTKALKILNIPMDGTHHRGIDDARNIAKIFIKHWGKK